MNLCRKVPGISYMEVQAQLVSNMIVPFCSWKKEEERKNIIM